LANIISLSRLPLLFIYIALLYTKDITAIFLCIPLIVFSILLDTADGMVARARGEVTLLGSALDIAVDRIFETVIWVVYADLDLIPIIIPIIVITRGVLTDVVRAVGMSDGRASFDQVRSRISRFLVSSHFMRGSYGVMKGLVFAAATASVGLSILHHPWSGWVHTLVLTLSWITVSITILRGMPVLLEGLKRYASYPPSA